MKKKNRLAIFGLSGLMAIGLCSAVCVNNQFNEVRAQDTSCSITFGSIGYWTNTKETKNGNEVTIWMNLTHTYIANITSIQEIKSVEVALNNDAKYEISYGEERHYFFINAESYMNVKSIKINYSCK